MANADKEPVSNNNNNYYQMLHTSSLSPYNFVSLLVLLLFLCFVFPDGVFSAAPIYGVFLS